MNRIQELRKAFNLSQKELADKMYVNQTAVSQWERGVTTPSPQTLILLANYFHVSVDYLLGKEDNQKIHIPHDGKLVEIKDIIKSRRLDLNLTILDVAKQVGVSESTISRWERGETDNIEKDKILKLSNVLKISPNIMMGWNETILEKQQINNLLLYDEHKQIPIIGTIACGTPIFAQENLSGYANVNMNIDADFALICKGDSMSPKFIDGDIVLIRQQPIVENGQIAAVLIENDATLKRVYIDDDKIILNPENHSFSPIVLQGEDMNSVKILGLAIGYTRIF